MSTIHPSPVVDAAAVLASARALAAEQGVAAAIEYATIENRRRRDPGIERQLVRWRMEAPIPRRSPRPDWPPRVPDLFGAADGLPEVLGRELTSERLSSALHYRGGLIVRGLVGEATATALARSIDRVFEQLEALARGDAPDPTWYDAVTVRGAGNDFLAQLRAFGQQAGGPFTFDSPRAAFELIDAFAASGVIDVIAGHLGERPTLSVQKTVLRRVTPSAGTDWHQDGAFLGERIRAVNVWLSLSDCGVHAPGLDILPRRVPHVVETGTRGAKFRWSVGPGTVEQVRGDTPLVAPVFRPGDALLFDQLLLHRTGVRPGMTETRWAAESWFFAPSIRPKPYFPIFM